jgi:putative spermidine/putrescine transport system substrate-binding protein
MAHQDDKSRSTGRVARWLICALIACVAGGLANSVPARGEEEVVVFAGWGGNIQGGERKVFFDSFEKATGIKVIDIPGVELSKIKAMVDSKNVEWDVAQALGMWVPQGEREDLWEPLDYSVIDKTGIPDALVEKYGVAISTFGQVLAYNTKAFAPGKEPKSWADFWDVERFPGKRGMLDEPRYNFEFALFAAGASPDQIYPIDMEKTFASLDRIKPHIHVWWKQWPQVPILLTSREIVMSPTSNTRIVDVRKTEGAPLEIVWNKSLMTVDYLSVPRGAPHKENAMKLINWMANAKLQAAYARTMGIGPSNVLAMDQLTQTEREELASYHYQKGEMVLVNSAWWAANGEKAVEAWTKWKLK